MFRLVTDDNDHISEYENNLKRKESYDSIVTKVYITFVIFIAALIFVLVWLPLLSKPTQSIRDFSSYQFPVDIDNYTKEYRSRISNVLYKTSLYVCDSNSDDKINCIDYTLVFYRLWTQYYPREEENIEIVRNVNQYTGMNHLFIRVRKNKNSPWECIEPQAPEYGPYFMEDFWDIYNPMYNIYGETSKWLMTNRNP